VLVVEAFVHLLCEFLCFVASKEGISAVVSSHIRGAEELID